MKGESHWNVRKALKLWKCDDKWEKKQRLMNGCNVTEEDAEQLLVNHHWDVSAAILFWNKQQKKVKETEGKITTSTEMQVIQKKKKSEKVTNSENDHQKID